MLRELEAHSSIDSKARASAHKRTSERPAKRSKLARRGLCLSVYFSFLLLLLYSSFPHFFLCVCVCCAASSFLLFHLFLFLFLRALLSHSLFFISIIYALRCIIRRLISTRLINYFIGLENNIYIYNTNNNIMICIFCTINFLNLRAFIWSMLHARTYTNKCAYTYVNVNVR